VKGENIGRVSGYIGATIGILGWLIGFSIVCVSYGLTGLLQQVFWPGLLISLIFAGLFVLIMELIIYRFGYGHYTLQLSLWSLLLSIMGIMWFLLNHWLAPIINSSPEAAQRLNQLGSVYETSDTAPLILMAAGALLLCATLFSVLFSNGKELDQ
jgi:hypothetical protein